MSCNKRDGGSLFLIMLGSFLSAPFVTIMSIAMFAMMLIVLIVALPVIIVVWVVDALTGARRTERLEKTLMEQIKEEEKIQ